MSRGYFGERHCFVDVRTQESGPSLSRKVELAAAAGTAALARLGELGPCLPCGEIKSTLSFFRSYYSTVSMTWYTCESVVTR